MTRQPKNVQSQVVQGPLPQNSQNAKQCWRIHMGARTIPDRLSQESKAHAGCHPHGTVVALDPQMRPLKEGIMLTRKAPDVREDSSEYLNTRENIIRGLITVLILTLALSSPLLRGRRSTARGLMATRDARTHT